MKSNHLSLQKKRHFVMEHSPVVFVEIGSEEIQIPWRAGQTLRNMMLDFDIPVLPGCNGTGQCGKCRVHVLQGKASEATGYEKRMLSPAELQSGLRLACQCVPEAGTRLKQVEPGSGASWTMIEGETDRLAARLPVVPATSYAKPYGLAVDLGTTRIRVSLHDLQQGQRLSACVGNNPQAGYGFDVLNRITQAVSAAGQAEKISRCARDAVKDAVFFLTQELGVAPGDIGRMVIVGNTAMLTLLTGKNYDALLNPDFWMRKIECQPWESASWRKEIGLWSKAEIHCVPPLAGFVGSDLVASVLAVGLLEGSSCSLLVDFGTNSEIALWDGKHLWVTAAAGGPAFEVCSLKNGMPAVEGALFRFQQKGPEEPPEYRVIGTKEPKGICGSGMVDIIASLVRQKRLKPNGNLVPKGIGNKIRLLPGDNSLCLHRQDVDAFMRAKAAVGAGIACLLERADRKLIDLDRLYVCGAFGRFLDLEHARQVGLLPPVPARRIELQEDAALLGAEQALYEPPYDQQVFFDNVTPVNLSSDESFALYFTNHLSLQPMREKEKI